MAKSGPIILVEDDTDDREILQEALTELKIDNELICFDDAPSAMQFLKTVDTQPFIILCDVNLPAVSGIQLKKNIDGDPLLRKKSIPFVFYTTFVENNAVNQVYVEATVQGFFPKGDTFQEIKDTMRLIFDYWMACSHPNS